MRIKPSRALLAACALGAIAVTPLFAGPGSLSFIDVPLQPKITGSPVPNVLASGYELRTLADGSYPVENPADLVASAATGIPAPATPIKISNYGFYGDGPLMAATGAATLSEPDKNTYLAFKAGQVKGADATYDYGRRFLFQGHEAGPGNAGYLTRINLDADQAHRVTLIASRDDKGNQIPAIDGSIWNPFTGKLLLSGEEGNKLGGIWEAGASPGPAQDLSGVFGRASYEGISVDPAGNVWLVEDAGGASPGSSSALDNARQPNSFLFRFVPADRANLAKGGKLQVLQVASRRAGNPAITFTACAAPADACLEADVKSQDLKDLHSYGTTFATKWITIRDTAVDGIADYDANALAKAKGGTPFKRPENGAFRPGVGFKEFYFTVTGDTNADKGSGAEYGQYGGVFRLAQSAPGSDTGTLSLAFLGDKEHTGVDNINFLMKDLVLVTEDSGDTLHTQRGKTDGMFAFDVRKAQPTAVRWYAQGRDPVATLRNADNEVTGIYVSNGDPSVGGLLGTKAPKPFQDGWRVFFTNQHGMNVTQEIVRSSKDD